MPRKKIKTEAKNIVIREFKKAPFKGVRELSQKLKKDYGLAVSKSSISNILKYKGLTQKPGRKEALPRYAGRQSDECGLYLLKALDSHIGLIEHTAIELGSIFSRIQKKTLKKVLILLAFSQFSGKDFKKSQKIKDFLRLAEFSRLPANSLDYFFKTLHKHKPLVDLSSVLANTQLTSTVKFIFNNGSIGFCDAQMTTFWDDVCRFERFFSPLGSVLSRISKMIKDKVFTIGYTKSFGALSLITASFVEGMLSGIRSLEVIDTGGKAIVTIPLKITNISLLFGYLPQILAEGIKPISKSKRLHKISAEKGFEFYGMTSQARVSDKNGKIDLFLSNTLIKYKILSDFSWGVFSTVPKSRKNFYLYIREYLCMWRYVNDDFFKDMEVIEKSAFQYEKKYTNISQMIPKRVKFADFRDFGKIGQILSILFKEIVGGWEPKAKKGSWRTTKYAIYFTFEAIPHKIKKSFNKRAFTLNKKLVSIV